jgi:hypothetical protein
MANTPLPAAKLQFFDTNGDPLNAGELFTYIPATTTTKLTYQDFAGTTPNTNPIVLNSRGETPFAVYGDGTYRLILKDSLGNTIWDTDTKSYATTVTSGDIITALGYTPVNPAANVSLSGNITFSGTNTVSGSYIFNGVATFNTAPVFNTPLTVTSTTLTILNLVNNDAGSATAVAELYRDSASPAASDLLYTLRFAGKSAAGNKRTYADLEAEIVDATNASEDGRLNLKTIIAGTLASRFSIQHGLYGSTVTGGDKGPNTINVAEYWRNNVALPRQVRTVLPSTTLGANVTRTIPHSLGIVPTIVGAYMTCTIADGGYTVGSVVQLATHGSGGTDFGLSIYADATNVYLRFPTNGMSLPRVTSSGNAVPTAGSWEVFVWVET